VTEVATAESKTIWYVYVLECSDRSLYTGISTNTERRFRQHLDGKGARYTRSHPPRRILASLAVDSHSQALKTELAIKRLKPLAKRAWCRQTAQKL
jgi:putative endonuclease